MPPPPTAAIGCSSMADITRESHYIPQATLKRWSLDGIHVSAYRLLVSHPNVVETAVSSIVIDRLGDSVRLFALRAFSDPCTS